MSFQSKNLSYMFNKEYYTAVTTPTGAARSEKEIAEVNRTFVLSGVPLEASSLGNHCFDLQVQYPGLLTGLGYAHKSAAIDGDIRGDIAQGFSFDYVTGVPYLPGSSVKGAIRNAFAPENRAYVQAFVGENVDVEELEQAIFGTPLGEDDADTDIFFDAYPSPKTPKTNTDRLFYLLDLDVVAPVCGENLSATPNVQQFLRVKPGVVFDFRFQLRDSQLRSGKFTAEEKRTLFMQILKDFGVGARTNVGYGVLDDVDPKLCINGKEQPSDYRAQRNGFQQRPRTDSAEPTRKSCPQCGRMNYKFRMNSQELNANWLSKTCFSCGGKLL